jgi:nucleotidyltransferase/DNA polymerase involved in DNA repair
MRVLALAWPELRVPDADVRPFEPMLDALDDLSPRVEAVDMGVALVDVTGLEPRWGSERRIAARAVALARTVAPLRVRCGIGENRWLATLAARLARFERPDAPAAFRVLERAELADLPLSVLPADPATSQRLALFGLTRMRQLAELPASAVGAQFGSAGERLQSLARGRDGRPIVPRRSRRRSTGSARRPSPFAAWPRNCATAFVPGTSRLVGRSWSLASRMPSLSASRSPSRSRPSNRTGSRASFSAGSRPQRVSAWHRAPCAPRAPRRCRNPRNRSPTPSRA